MICSLVWPVSRLHFPAIHSLPLSKLRKVVRRAKHVPRDLRAPGCDVAASSQAREALGDMLKDGLTVAKAAASKAAVSLNFQEKMIAGATARGVSQTILHPIDVARTRLQAKGVKKDWSPKVFLKGVLPQIILAVPAGALQFVGFEFCKEQLPNILPGAGLADMRSLISGAGGALAASVIRVPQEVLKQRIQADMYPNLAVALPSILKKDGPAGLYK